MNTTVRSTHEINRRQFLGSSAKNAAGMAAGMVGLSAAAAHVAPAERVSVGVIGCRSQGKRLAVEFAQHPAVDVTAVCDVDEAVLAAAAAAVMDIQGRAPRRQTDFRRLLEDRSLDAVVLATPDHWHAVMTVNACRAGKDVYVEAPVSHAVAEGTAMCAAARQYGRVVQSGLQQRSGRHFQSAVEFVRSGQLGRVRLAKAWTVQRRKSIGVRGDSTPPASVDYDLWLGPAPARGFNANRFHANWQWFWDYGSGALGQWGVHMLDVARWGLGVELPVRVSAAGGNYHFRDDQETPDTLVVNYEFPGKTIVWEHRLWSSRGIEGRSTAAAFYGEAGTLIVDRGGWKVYDHDQAPVAEKSSQLQQHVGDFIDCVQSRRRPAANIEIGHISSTLAHLGNIAYRLAREVAIGPCAPGSANAGFPTWSPAEPVLLGDADANRLLAATYREPWELA